MIISGRRRRALRRGDVDAVMAIDAVSYSQPWGRQLYLDDIGDSRRGVHLVATEDDMVIGHAGTVYLDGDAHVSTVAVHPGHLGRGVATELLVDLVEAAIADGCGAMTLEVRVDNQRAIDLYRRCGFSPVGVRPGYYDGPDGRTDALVMWLHDLPAAHERMGSLLSAASGRGGD